MAEALAFLLATSVKGPTLDEDAFKVNKASYTLTLNSTSGLQEAAGIGVSVSIDEIEDAVRPAMDPLWMSHAYVLHFEGERECE